MKLLKTVDDLGDRKARGAFFTPPEIADFMVNWAIRDAGDSILEPSCGEAAFLVSAFDRLSTLQGAPPPAQQIHGCDIHGTSVDLARAAVAGRGGSATLVETDFFDFTAGQPFDAVVGNPPYVRYQAFAGANRRKGFEAALAQGVRLPGLASSWAAFTIHAASFLKPEGRLALVIPAELLSVNYAAPVRRYLMKRFRTVTLVLFEERVFPGVLEEVVLLLAEGEGPTDRCELRQCQKLSDLAHTAAVKPWKPPPGDGKWITGLLSEAGQRAYQRAVSESNSFETLNAWGDVTLGMVTGNNGYFALTAAKAAELQLRKTELTLLCPPGSRHLRGLVFGLSSWREMREAGSACYLFDPPVSGPSARALAYVEQGEKSGVHTAYKCRVRTPWWKVPRVPMPDAFLTYMNADTPRLVSNRARVTYLNSVHGVTYRRERRQLALDLLPLAWLNTVTVLGCEIVGRSYGGGMLKLEPREADVVPVPSLEVIQAAAPALRALRPQVAKDLRQGRLAPVLRAVDHALRPHIQLGAKDLEHISEARRSMFERRASRSRKDR